MINEHIKNKLIDNEITQRVKNYSKNKSDLDTDYYVGKMLSEAGKHYGEGIIKEYSKKIDFRARKGIYIYCFNKNEKVLYTFSKTCDSVAIFVVWSLC